MKNLQIILNSILSKNVFEYVLVNEDLKTIHASHGIEKYLNGVPKEGEDILEYLPELVGNEEEVKKIFIKKYCLYGLEAVYKNEYYVNISIEYCDNNTAIILIHNITATTLSQQKLLQYSNESTLLYNTLQKVIDNQNTYVFVANRDNEIAFANQKFIEYFKAKDLKDLNEKNINICQYTTQLCNGYDDLYDYAYGEEKYITIDHDTFIIEANNIDLKYKLFTLTRVTEMYKKKEILEAEVQIDPLTQTYRKKYFEILLVMEFELKKDLALAVVDIDNFKNINDTYGHSSGDVILQEFTALIKENLRNDDIIGRWGGEEFLILLKGSNEENTLAKVEALRRVIENNVFSFVGTMNASFGIALYNSTDDVSSLLHRADMALYEAKNDGKNCVRLKKD